VPSSGGVFEVTLNGQKIYSKAATGEFPDFDALLQTVRAKL
jgi:selenoprotein W-related protein